MRIRATLFLCLPFVANLTQAQDQDSRELFGEAPKILASLSEITGWKAKRTVPADIITKDQLHRFVEDRMKREMKPEDIRIEDLTLKMFGLAPKDFDMQKATVDLLTEQAAAFYDYNKKRLFILETQSSIEEKRIALVHELAHALADQNFPLKKYIRQGASSDDGETAREAVMEGQATWLMWAYTSKSQGGPPLVPEPALKLLGPSAAASDSQYPVFANAPLYLRESLVFPYTYGMLFQDAIFKANGRAAFSEVFEHAPVSSQQILHPEKYLHPVIPAVPVPPAPPRPKEYKELASGNVGEFDHSILLRQYLGADEAKKIVGHWAGGAYRLLEAKKDRDSHVLCYVVQWDSVKVAQSYFEQYERVLRGKWKTMNVLTRTADTLTGTGDYGRFLVHRDGDRVSSLEGLPPDAVN